MEKQITFTSTLPEKVLRELNHHAELLKTKKNKIIEQALRKYFEEQRKGEFIQSFRRANNDEEMISLAEEGIADYLKLLDQ
jgi:metal-responsive CopG/Arc/MetJ family transcriptional regulator